MNSFFQSTLKKIIVILATLVYTFAAYVLASYWSYSAKTKYVKPVKRTIVQPIPQNTLPSHYDRLEEHKLSSETLTQILQKTDDKFNSIQLVISEIEAKLEQQHKEEEEDEEKEDFTNVSTTSSTEDDEEEDAESLETQLAILRKYTRETILEEITEEYLKPIREALKNLYVVGIESSTDRQIMMHFYDGFFCYYTDGSPSHADLIRTAKKVCASCNFKHLLTPDSSFKKKGGMRDFHILQKKEKKKSSFSSSSNEPEINLSYKDFKKLAKPNH